MFFNDMLYNWMNMIFAYIWRHMTLIEQYNVGDRKLKTT